MEKLEEFRPLHLHTLQSLCADLVSGRQVGVGEESHGYKLDSLASRSVLDWYRNNQEKWVGNVRAADIENIVDCSLLDPRLLRQKVLQRLTNDMLFAW